MIKYAPQKRSAFFGSSTLEIFFESETNDNNIIVEDLKLDIDVDKELDAILAEK